MGVWKKTPIRPHPHTHTQILLPPYAKSAVYYRAIVDQQILLEQPCRRHVLSQICRDGEGALSSDLVKYCAARRVMMLRDNASFL